MTVHTKPPKPRNAPKTKAQILAAAQDVFAEIGYAQAGIRDIAARAGVTAPMLLRYFGSKIGLFEAALTENMQVENLFSVERAQFGAHLASLLVDSTRDFKSPSIVALSSGDADARDIATQATNRHVVEPLAKWLGPPDARSRALQIVMVGMGFVLYTRQFPLLSVGNGADRKTAQWLAQTVQAIVDQS
jgi:AcrR family transcriptional regulator